MINKVSHQIAIRTLISILILVLVTLFATTAHAVPCHNSGQGTFQLNQKPDTAVDISSTVAAIEINTIICSALCNRYNIPVGSLLISSSFENKQAVDIPKTNHHNDSDLEDTQANLKLQAYYRISHSIPSSILQTTLKHRVLLI